MAELKSVNIIGTDVTVATLDQGLELARAAMAQGPARYIVLPHVEFLVKAQQQPTIQVALRGAYARLPNGVGLNWAAAYLYGQKPPRLGRIVTLGAQIVFKPKQVEAVLPARFTSSNFTWQLLKAAAEAGQSVFLVGSPKRQSIEAVAAYVAGTIPRLKVAGTFTGHLDSAKEQELLAKLRSTQPDLILVGMGFPRQEQLMQRLSTQLDHGLMIGEGGSFDYEQFGGHIKRAPAWAQRSGLEWLWRLLREPSRLGRQLSIPVFIWRVYLQGRKTSH